MLAGVLVCREICDGIGSGDGGRFENGDGGEVGLGFVEEFVLGMAEVSIKM